MYTHNNSDSKISHENMHAFGHSIVAAPSTDGANPRRGESTLLF